MDQNNFNPQGNENNNQTNQQQNGYYQQSYYGNQQQYYGNQQQYYGNQQQYYGNQQGAYYQDLQQPDSSSQYDDPRISELVDSAFGKALAANIMCAFPITSIISIILGAKAGSLVRQANTLAAACGKKAGGKSIAAKIMGGIGKGFGIGMTIFWALYFFIIIVAILGTI